MVIYADLIFLMNLMIDAAMLYMTAWCRRLKPPWWRIWLGAVIGASYVVMMLFPTMSSMLTFAVKCLFSVVMLSVSFGVKDLGYFIRNLAVFYMVNFATAGGMIGIHYMLQSTNEVMNGIVFTQSGTIGFQVQVSTALIVTILIPILWWLRKVLSMLKQRETIRIFRASLTVYFDEIKITCDGLIDTGNQLYDPLTRTPVIVMEVNGLRSILSDAWLRRIEKGETEEIMLALEEENPIWRHRLRFIPYQGIQKGTHFMLALKPDEVVIMQEDRSYRTKKVLIGLKGGTLSREGDYQAIIHPDLVTESTGTVTASVGKSASTIQVSQTVD